MLLHNLIKSNEKRMAKKILTDQIEQQRNNCWYSQLKEQMEKYEIFDEIEQVKFYKELNFIKMEETSQRQNTRISKQGIPTRKQMNEELKICKSKAS